MDSLNRFLGEQRCVQSYQDAQREKMKMAVEYRRRVERDGKGLRKKPAIGLYREICAFQYERLERADLRRVKYGSWAIDLFYRGSDIPVTVYNRVDWETERRYLLFVEKYG